MTIKAVLFDFGNTLVSIEIDWEKVIPQNIESLVQHLQHRGFSSVDMNFGRRFYELKKEYNEKGRGEMHEYPVKDILQKTFQEYGHENSSPDVLEEAADSFFIPEEKLYPLTPYVYEVLDELKKQGYRLGVVSNASSGSLIRTALEHRKLTPYFDTIVVSADIGYRKPHPKIFQIAMENLQVLPEETIMVGDVPAYDVAGPKPLGIRTILVGYIESGEAKRFPADILPDATAYSFSEIPAIIKAWE